MKRVFMKKPVLLLLAGLALLPAGRPAAAPRNILTVERPQGPEWFGLYLVGKKAGWSRMEILRQRRNGKSVLVARSETVLRAMLATPDGATKSVSRTQRDERIYEAKPGGRLLSFKSEREGDGGTRMVEASCTSSGCRATLTAEGAPPEVRDLPPTSETAEQADAARLVAALRTTIRGSQLEPEQLRVKKVEDVYKGRAKLAGGGVEVDVSVVAESEVGDRMPVLVSVADDGRVLEMRFGESLVGRSEPETLAKQLDRVDLFGLSRVPIPAPLSQEVPGSAVFRIRGLPPEFQKPDSRQSYAKGEVADESVLTVRARLPAAADPRKDAPRGKASSEDTKELLAPTPTIDSDHAEIRKLAAKWVAGTPGVYAASVKISENVYGLLKKVYGASRDRASEVLRSGQGDCTEHTLLFLALARAAGIPARGVYGLVYARYQDGIPALYWHAWAEVKSGDEWISLDPTFGQPVADATHIALGRGTQVDTVGLIGGLKVVAAEARPADEGGR
jgi:transglutaminase-like putative cysteine protease